MTEKNDFKEMIDKYKSEIINIKKRSPDIAPISVPKNKAPKTSVSDEEHKSQGAVQVQVYTAKEALPIKGAHVTISRTIDNKEKLYYLTETDQSGYTPILEVPTVSADLSQSPGNKKPYISYNIRTDYPDFFTVLNSDVPVYEGTTAIQQVEMVPLPENYEGDKFIKFIESGPDIAPL